MIQGLRVAILGLCAASYMNPAQGQDPNSTAPRTQPIYVGPAPGALGNDPGDGQVPGDIPTIQVFLAPAETANGAAVLICPGGGYGALATNHEGVEVARWLNRAGVAGIVLRYRLGPKYHHPAMLMDASRAIRTVRARADEWGLDPGRVAVLGFSAGGHLASTLATHFDEGVADAADFVERMSSRPDLAILVYPVIALDTPYGHVGSLKNLLGPSPDPELIGELSNQTRVTAETPPTFLVHTNEDEGVPAENSLLYAEALRKAGVAVELHLFEGGRHGLGLGTGSKEHGIAGDAEFSAWPSLCEAWLKRRGFFKPTSTDPAPVDDPARDEAPRRSIEPD